MKSFIIRSLFAASLFASLANGCASAKEQSKTPSAPLSLKDDGLLRIYPLGDSITRGIDDSGYRPALYDDLNARGVKFHFVGSLSHGPATLPERNHDGHNGWVTQQITDNIDGWLASYQPNIILLMIGSNDIEGAVDLPHLEDRFQRLLDRILRDAPQAHLFVSEVSLIRDPRFDQEARDFNPKIQAMVTRLRAQGQAITFVPMHDIGTLDEIDGLDHPNPIGNKKMADRWMTYLSPAL